MPSIKRNITYNIVLQILNVLFPIVTVPYVSRILGVENIGIVNFTLTYVSYFALFAALGIGYYGIREIAKHKDDPYNVSKIFTEIFSINIVSTIISAIVFILTLYIIPALAGERTLFLIAGITLYLTPLSIDWLFQGLEDFKVITIRSLIVRILCIVALFIFVREGNDVILYVLLNTGSAVCANLWNFWYARTKYIKLNFHNPELRKHIKPIFVLFSSIIAISIFTMLDTLMLGFISSYEDVGYYTSATKITRIVLPLFTAISGVIMPRISYNKEKNEHDSNRALLQKSFDLTILFTIPAMIGLLFIAPRFVPVFFGVDFLGTVIPLQILSLLMVVVALNVFFGVQILVGMGYEKSFFKAVITAAIVNFTFNLILIPMYGARGAAVASVVGESIQLVMNLYFIYKYTDIRINWRSSNKVCWSIIPVVVLYYFLSIIIANNIGFIVLYVVLAVLIYFVFQCFVFKNYLLKNICIQLVNKVRI